MAGTRGRGYCFAALLVPVFSLGPAREAGAGPSYPNPNGVPAWPQVPAVASYRIGVRLDTEGHTLSGHETITCHNRTAEAIPELVFHLYLNAFRSPATTFMRDSGGVSRGFSANLTQPGWTEVAALALVSPQLDPGHHRHAAGPAGLAGAPGADAERGGGRHSQR